MEAFSLDLIIEKAVREDLRQEKDNNMNKDWLKGLLVALAGGALIGATQSLSAGKVTAKGTGSAAAAGALTVLTAYLAQSPLAPAPVAEVKAV